ncbi:predicted protein, partial [Nematostella vectensis]
DPCEPNPCQHGGVCTESGCMCPSSYYGTYYSFCITVSDGCEPNPCANGGTCSRISFGSNFTCTCPYGYTGKNCTVGK